MAHPQIPPQLDSPWLIQQPPPSLPRYGIRDDERTKPGVVIVDWSGDEATMVSASPDDAAYEAVDEDDLDLDYNPFAPRWQGIGRKPGAVALAMLLGFCLAIGLAAVFAPSDAQAGAPGAGADLALR
jgi:hypothetical protein